MAEISKTPWRFDRDYVRDGDGKLIASVFWPRTNGPLLAAAPALKEALEHIEIVASQDGDTFDDTLRPSARMDSIRTAARAALALCNPKEGE